MLTSESPRHAGHWGPHHQAGFGFRTSGAQGGLRGRSVLEGLLDFFHKLFTEVLKYITGRHKSIQIVSTQFICHKTDRIM